MADMERSALAENLHETEVVSADVSVGARPWADRGGWTEERVELLKKLWSDGLACSEIAAELGGTTRNAVIGKVHRLGLSGRAKNLSGLAPRPRKPRAQNRRRVLRSMLGVGFAAAAQFEADAEPEAELLEVPVEQRKTLLQINDKHCHWPVGDPASGNFYFCGGEAVEGKLGGGCQSSLIPYCEYHCRVAYQPYERRSMRYLRPSYRT